MGSEQALIGQIVKGNRNPQHTCQTLGEAALGLLLGEYELLEFHSHLWFLPCFFVTAVLYNILVNSLGYKFIRFDFREQVSQGIVYYIPKRSVYSPRQSGNGNKNMYHRHYRRSNICRLIVTN